MDSDPIRGRRVESRGSVASQPAPRLAVRVLGELVLVVDGRPVTVTTGRLRVLLAVLAVAAGRAVSVDRLAGAIWDGDPPANIRRTVQTYVARLRGIVGTGAIGKTPGGYLLRVDPTDVDTRRFEDLLTLAARTPDPAARYELLTRALQLWRGTPFENVPSRLLAESEGARLHERYLTALERRVDLDLAAGRTDAVVAELSELAVRHPLRESLWARLLVAFDRAGRQAEALASYETIRARLADELGVAPGPELQQIFADLLAGHPIGQQKPAETAPEEPPRADAAQPVVPRQLPPPLDAFTGRRAELKELDSHGAGTRVPGATRVVLVHGPAGVGKTALAVGWAHQAADRFPDGQLYVNLRGFDPAGDAAVEPAAAVRTFLDALGVAPDAIPAEPAAQAALYRSRLADRRLLMVLDNARDATQVRPLLPSGSGCLVLVTSRDQMPGLIVSDGARPVAVDLFSDAEAWELLGRRLGADRVSREPGAVERIIRRCGQLPLALAVVAARAAIHPEFALATFAAELEAADGGLDAFTVTDAATDLRAVFSWSYRRLTPAAARLFRLLALQPGAEVTVPGAASLAGVPPRRARQLVAELTGAHLLTERVAGRYGLHDLLRRYATELSTVYDDEADRSSALRRVLDHYLHTGAAAALLLDPKRLPIALDRPAPEVSVEPLRDRAEATAWLAAERTTILRAAALAAENGLLVHAWQLVWVVAQFLFIHLYWADLIASQVIALDATSRLGDRAEQARAHRSLGSAYAEVDRYEEAYRSLESARRLYEEVGDADGQAIVCGILGSALAGQHRYGEATEQAWRGWQLARAAGDRRAEGNSLNEVGWYQAKLGNYAETLIQCRRALGILNEIGDERGAAWAWSSVGYAELRLHRRRPALYSYRKAIDLFERTGDRYSHARALRWLGDAHAELGDPDAARDARLAALRILDDLGHPDAVRLRAAIGRRGNASDAGR
ncbi:AfsR/SARP family transcriptional regulator [Virgisporangium aurantiacum]|uniref:SARP family transcriptional regulator n=1 Tax=Virgisporangium aurantiacum TaxID=175570 RepID=A0A8J3ZN46_9ACTN|nr:BTAD domain-containing putative transcriptional regulator [Virgisporangium aurantiacum]GIJ64490.1 SARP family transcriptional regulator [Virgisporangium aurantiacum]